MLVNNQSGYQFDVEIEYENIKKNILKELQNLKLVNITKDQQEQQQVKNSKLNRTDDHQKENQIRSKTNQVQQNNKSQILKNKNKGLTDEELRQKKIRILKALEKHIKKGNDIKTQNSLKKLGLWDIFNKESSVDKLNKKDNQGQGIVTPKVIDIKINPQYIQKTRIINLCKPEKVNNKSIKICQELTFIFQILIFVQLFVMIKGINQIIIQFVKFKQLIMNKQNNELHFNNNLLQNGLASSFCGIISVTAANVFDIARIQMLEQSFKENSSLQIQKQAQFKTHWNKIHYKLDYFKNNTFRIFKKQFSKQGFTKTFFTGYTRQVQLNTVRNLTFFPLLENFKKLYQKHREVKDSKAVLKQTLFATSMSRFLNSFLLFPLEILRIEKQLQNSKQISLLKIMKKIYQNRQRYKITFLRYQITQNIASCTFFCTYEETKFKLNTYQYYKQKPFYYLFLHSSLVTTFLTAFIFYPFEIMQVGSVVMNKKMKIREFYEILSRKIGKVGILKGSTNYLIRHFISMSIFFGLYETYKLTNVPLQLSNQLYQQIMIYQTI